MATQRETFLAGLKHYGKLCVTMGAQKDPMEMLKVAMDVEVNIRAVLAIFDALVPEGATTQFDSNAAIEDYKLRNYPTQGEVN